uniref:Uncharacterized protein n=1 Tax=Oryza meridionalis TaxID=40149 RepID=A0A0E0DTB6_9ORYZ
MPHFHPSYFPSFTHLDSISLPPLSLAAICTATPVGLPPHHHHLPRAGAATAAEKPAAVALTSSASSSYRARPRQPATVLGQIESNPRGKIWGSVEP